MAYPADPLDVRTELYLSGAWVDVTADVLVRDGGVSVTRGRRDESSQAEASKCTLSIRNTEGTYMPRWPSSPYYGVLGRNTPIRVAVAGAAPTTYLELPGDDSSKATAPDAPGLGITGDLDLRVDVEIANWQASQDVDFAAKYAISGDQRSWSLRLDTTGALFFQWSTNGTLAGVTVVATTTAVPVPVSGRQAFRVTLDVDNGAAGSTVTFYTAETIAGPWEQLGDPVVTAGVTSVFDSTAEIELGNTLNIEGIPVAGRFYAMELRNGIDGPLVADPDFTAQTPGAATFADSSGNTWTIEGQAAITDRLYRYAGEVSEWPPRWDVTEADKWTPIEAAGILRRLGQGGQVLDSVMYRGMVRDAAGLVAYWPCEDAEGSASIAAATPETPPLRIIGSPELSSNEDFASSHPLPVLNGASFSGNAPPYTATTQTQVRFLASVPAGGAEDNQGLLTIYTTGSVRRWEVHYGTGGTLGLRGVDASGTTLFDSGDIAFAVNGSPCLISVELTQDGADVDWILVVLPVGDLAGTSWSGTLAANTVGSVGSLVVSPNGGISEVAVGHLSVQNTITSIFSVANPLNAWTGERAGRRIERLCAEEGVAFTARGDLDATAVMGAQWPGGLLDVLAEAADTDAGILYESRHELGLSYRTRESVYNQDAGLALDYAAGHLTPPLEPTDDDQAVRNDITVSRVKGSSARAVLAAGPLSVNAPPDGVGRYDEQVTINPRYDADLTDQAWWRLHVATVDESRWPVVTVDLSARLAEGLAELVTSAAELDVGDLVTVDNLPSPIPPDQVTQICQGTTETLSQYEWLLGITCTPASPYTVATYDGTARYGPAGTVLAEALDTTETGVDIDTPTGPLWDTTASGFDIVVGGERMTVTAVGAAAGTVQTLTVTRSANGVTKSHSTGAEVAMAIPAIYAL